jgi:putative DNA primase/helicase
MANKIIELSGGRILVIKEFSQERSMYSFNGKFWEESAATFKEVLDNDLHDLVKNRYDAIKDTLTDSKASESIHRSYSRTLGKIRSTAGFDSIKKMVINTSNIRVSLSDFEYNPYIVNCRNGALDIRTGHLGHFDRNDMMLGVSPVTWNPDAKCPRFMQFLDEILGGDRDGETIQFYQKFLQKYFGLALSGLSRGETMLFLYGPTARNGKSTLVNIISEVVGHEYVGYISASLAFATGFGNRIDECLGDIIGKRMVVISEFPDGRLDGNHIKRLVNDDVKTGRILYKGIVKFRSKATFITFVNDKPNFMNLDEGAVRRMLFIELHRKFIDENGPDKGIIDNKYVMKSDNTMYPYIIKNELSGILKWLVDGFQEFHKENFVIEALPEMRQHVLDMAEDTGHFGSFFSQCFIVKKNMPPVPNKKLREVYDAWCADNEIPLKHRYSDRKMGLLLMRNIGINDTRFRNELTGKMERAKSGIHPTPYAKSLRNKDKDWELL